MAELICQRCGKKIVTTEKRGKPKYCPDCRREVRKETARNFYRKQQAELGKTVKELPPRKPPARFVWTKTKPVCLFTHCPFKHADRPCLFYFEYKDGKSSCPGVKFMNKGVNVIGD